jgi:hypothetical protein
LLRTRSALPPTSTRRVSRAEAASEIKSTLPVRLWCRPNDAGESGNPGLDGSRVVWVSPCAVSW